MFPFFWIYFSSSDAESDPPLVRMVFLIQSVKADTLMKHAPLQVGWKTK